MITQTVCTSFRLNLLSGLYKFGTTPYYPSYPGDTFKIALYTSMANLGVNTTNYTTNNEVVGAGYTAGGAVLTVIQPLISGTSACVSFENIGWSGANFLANGALIYDDTIEQFNLSNPGSNLSSSVAVLNFGNLKTFTPLSNGIIFPVNDANNAIIRLASVFPVATQL